MQRPILLPFFLVLGIVSPIFMSCATFENPPELLPYLDPDELKVIADGCHEDFVIIDVRTPEEFEAGHIPNAINIEMGKVENLAHPPAKDKHIIVYCRSGNRSNDAALHLQELGYTSILNFGGIRDYSHELQKENTPCPNYNFTG
jgi:rhodanese-related sulfurtransferase